MKWLQKQKHFDWMQKGLICWRMCEKLISESIQNAKFIPVINFCRDTAEMCSQCIKFEAQRSPFFKHLCEVCADICKNCSQELSKYKNQDQIILETIKACNKFATACKEVAEAKDILTEQ